MEAALMEPAQMLDGLVQVLVIQEMEAEQEVNKLADKINELNRLFEAAVSKRDAVKKDREVLSDMTKRYPKPIVQVPQPGTAKKPGKPVKKAPKVVEEVPPQSPKAQSVPRVLSKITENPENAEEFIYADAKRSFVKLTGAEEFAIFKKIRAGCKKSHDSFIRNNQKLVMSCAFEFASNCGLDMADLIQEGNLGLLRAVRNFKPELGYKFSTYAVWVIEQFMTRGVRSKGTLIRRPSKLAAKIVKVQKAWNKFRQDNSAEPTPVWLMENCELSLDDVLLCRQILQDPVSLDTSPEEGEEMKLLDLFKADGLYPDEIAERSADLELVHNLLDKLSPEDRELVSFRFGIGDSEPKTRLQLSMFYGLSELELQRQEHKALEQLRSLAQKDLFNADFVEAPPTKKVRINTGCTGRRRKVVSLVESQMKVAAL